MKITVNPTRPCALGEYSQSRVEDIERLTHREIDFPFALTVNFPTTLEVILTVVDVLYIAVDRPLTNVSATSGVTLIGENALIGLEYRDEVLSHGYHEVKLILLK